MTFYEKWAEAAYTSTGFFWMALWAFILGYAVSSLIQVFVSEDKMKNLMGDGSLKSMSMASFFGFISSSCSFSALATTKTNIARYQISVFKTSATIKLDAMNFESDLTQRVCQRLVCKVSM